MITSWQSLVGGGPRRIGLRHLRDIAVATRHAGPPNHGTREIEHLYGLDRVR
jgi:hypothetical protein